LAHDRLAHAHLLRGTGDALFNVEGIERDKEIEVVLEEVEWFKVSSFLSCRCPWTRFIERGRVRFFCHAVNRNQLGLDFNSGRLCPGVFEYHLFVLLI
jgi:hypothetical protein